MVKRSDYTKPQGERYCAAHRLKLAVTETKAHQWTAPDGDWICPGYEKEPS